MLSHDEVVDLLTAVAAYDNRKPNPASVLAWGKAAEIGRWALPEALDAVHAHFAECPEYLMPAHVGNRIRDRRQDAALRTTSAELGAAPAPRAAIEASEQWRMDRNHGGQPSAAEVTRFQVVAELARTIKQRTTDKPHPPGYGPETRRAALRVACPFCRAREFQDCTRFGLGGPRRRSTPHPSRVELAEARETA